MKKTQPRTHAQKVTHHAKRVIQITPKFVHGMFAGAFFGALVVGVVSMVNPANALSITSKRDCDDNAVLRCGTLTTAELKEKYAAGNANADKIYAAYNIDAADIANADATAKAGKVYKNGTVTVGNTVVATNAATAGRQNIAGSQKVTKDGFTFYNRAPSVSFRSDALDAFVFMKNGQFDFAILGACGNPVVATPVNQPTPPTPPKPSPSVPQPAPPQPVVSQAVAAPTAPVVEQVAAEPAKLPNAGAGAIIAIAVLSLVGGYVFHLTHRHVQHRRHNKRVKHHKPHHA